MKNFIVAKAKISVGNLVIKGVGEDFNMIWTIIGAVQRENFFGKEVLNHVIVAGAGS